MKQHLFDEKTGEVIAPFDGWAPYCSGCNARRRMQPQPFGWRCRSCGAEVNRKLQPHQPDHGD